MRKLDKIVNKIIKLSFVDPFERSRKRDVIYVRGLLIHLLTKYFQMGCTEIKKYFAKKGLILTHGAIINAQKKWEVYSFYDKNLNKWANEILLDDKVIDDPKKINYVIDKIKYLKDEDLDQIYILTNKFFEAYLNQEQLKNIEVDNAEAVKY